MSQPPPEGSYAAFCRQTDNGYQLLLVVDGFTSSFEANSWLCEMMTPFCDDLNMEMEPGGWVH